MCIDAPESTTNSRSSSLRFDAGRHLFSDGEKNVALFFSFHFNTLVASFHAASRALRSCHSVSSWDRSSNLDVGAALMRFLWADHSDRKILILNLSVMCNIFREFYTLDWFSACLSSSVRLMTTSAAPYYGIHNPIVVYLMSCAQRVSPFYRMTHDSSTWPLHFFLNSFETFARLFINLAMRIRALFPKSATTLGLVEQAFWRVPLLTEWIGPVMSSFQLIITILFRSLRSIVTFVKVDNRLPYILLPNILLQQGYCTLDYSFWTLY